MIPIGSDMDIGRNRNNSVWLRINSYPILSRGLINKCLMYCKAYIDRNKTNNIIFNFILRDWKISNNTMGLLKAIF